ncbi:hypothetical protein NEMIN01_0483 [Nematocida minor]|uniref:uncharacterized protein n=1 Tax=Nematocida minor TaxID=1912983 RepID=UPI0022201326|nr:uncharacterized protein NEMIN01_0483 [Nematocida minor]KAI5189420.1 hypothetical protein NEMIN01_0483 [Nematocida minor]
MKATIGICMVGLLCTVGYITMTHRAQTSRILLEVASDLNAVKAKISHLLKSGKVKSEKVEKALAGDLKNIERKMEKIKDSTNLKQEIDEKTEVSAEPQKTPKALPASSILESTKSKTGPGSIADTALLSNSIVDHIIESYLKGALPMETITKAIIERPELLSLVPKLLGTEKVKKEEPTVVRASEIPTTLMKNIIEEQQESIMGARYTPSPRSRLNSFMRLKAFAAQPSPQTHYMNYAPVRTETEEKKREDAGAQKMHEYMHTPVSATLGDFGGMGYYMPNAVRDSLISKKQEIEAHEEERAALKEHENLFTRAAKKSGAAGILGRAINSAENTIHKALLNGEISTREFLSEKIKPFMASHEKSQEKVSQLKGVSKEEGAEKSMMQRMKMLQEKKDSSSEKTLGALVIAQKLTPSKLRDLVREQEKKAEEQNALRLEEETRMKMAQINEQMALKKEEVEAEAQEKEEKAEEELASGAEHLQKIKEEKKAGMEKLKKEEVSKLSAELSEKTKDKISLSDLVKETEDE